MMGEGGEINPSDLRSVSDRMLTAVRFRPRLDCEAVLKLLQVDGGAGSLPLDIILNQTRDAAFGSGAVASTASQILKEHDPLSVVDKLLGLGALTASCVEVAAIVLKAMNLAHPVAEATDIHHARTASAFDVRVRESSLDFQPLKNNNSEKSFGAVVLLDFLRPTQSWIICAAEPNENRNGTIVLKPIVRRVFAEPAGTARYLLDSSEIMLTLRAARPNANPSFIRVPNTTLDPAIAVFVDDRAEDLVGRLVARFT